MRILGSCLILLSLFSVAACLTEVKPILKPAEVGIPDRIVNLQKWIDQSVSSSEISRDQAKPLQEKLYEIKEKYNQLQAKGPLTPKDSERINKMLDDCSNAFFQQKIKKQQKAY